MSVLPMLSQGVIEEAEHVGKQLGMGSGQPWLRFDHGDEALFEILKRNIVNWASFYTKKKRGYSCWYIIQYATDVVIT